MSINQTRLTPVQAEGVACVICNADYLTVKTPHVPVGRSNTASQVFACVGLRTETAAVSRRRPSTEHQSSTVSEPPFPERPKPASPNSR